MPARPSWLMQSLAPPYLEFSATGDRVLDVDHPTDHTGPIEGDGDEVDSPDPVRQVGVFGQEGVGGGEEAAGLTSVDGLFGAAHRLAAAGLDLDEDDLVVGGAHHEIQFASGAVPAGGEEAVS